MLRILLFSWFCIFTTYVSRAQAPSLKNVSIFKVDSIQSLITKAATVGDLGSGASPASKLWVLAFLSPECPLCKNYSKSLEGFNKNDDYPVDWIGVVPGKYTEETVKSFHEEYMPDWPLIRDTTLEISKYTGATVTPEVIVIDKSTGVVVYKGAIDDWVVSLGKTRNTVKQHYLDIAINNYVHKKPAIPYTEAVGCLINDF